MELILKEDVQNLGFKDDIVTVKNGYGRNYLIPQGLAFMATPSAKKVLAENLKQRAHKEAKLIDEANKVLEALAELSIKISAKTGEGTKLFGSVGSADVAEAIAKEGQEIDKKYISIHGGTVKRVGPYTASIRLHREVSTELAFEVVAEAK